MDRVEIQSGVLAAARNGSASGSGCSPIPDREHARSEDRHRGNRAAGNRARRGRPGLRAHPRTVAGLARPDGRRAPGTVPGPGGCPRNDPPSSVGAAVPVGLPRATAARGRRQGAGPLQTNHPRKEVVMGKTERPARGRNIGNGALMSSPYAAEVSMHPGRVIGVGPTAAVLTLGGGAAAYGVARYRDTPGKRARRDLRRASRAATTAGSPRRRVSNSRGGPSLGSKGRAKYATGAARRSGHGGATSRRARSAAGHGGIGSKGRSSTSTALLDRKGKPPAGRGRAHAGSLGNRPGGRGGRSSRTPFGRGPRASAARQQAAARRGRHGGLGGLLGGGKAPKRNEPGRRRGGLSAGLGLLSGRRGWKSGSRGYWNRRRTAAARAMQRQRNIGNGAK